MGTDKNREEEALFESIGDDGTRWLFVALPDDRWAITRNGERVVVGAGNRASIDAGVRRFQSMAAAVALPGRVRRANAAVAVTSP
jgi:hypothetical protein